MKKSKAVKRHITSDHEYYYDNLFTNNDRVSCSIDFMRYNLFGISENDLLCTKNDKEATDLILGAAISKAYIDASRHVLKKGTNDDATWKAKKEKATKTIKRFINDLERRLSGCGYVSGEEPEFLILCGYPDRRGV